MFLSPRIRLKPLATLCRRLAFATSAGLEDRKIWRDEAARSRGREQVALQEVADRLARGESISDALAQSDGYLPRMFKQIVAIGDTSGRLDHAYKRLAEHYEHAQTAKRSLMTALAWPMIQLFIAMAVVGLVIWISGALQLQNLDGEPLDLFGLGISGSSGLVLYVGCIGVAVAAVLLAIEAGRRGVLWTRHLQRGLLRVPALGEAVRTLALARFTWALQLILDTSMDLRKALPLALDASGNDYYRSLGPQVASNIQHGMSLHSALAETNAFPSDLLESIAIGEQTGMMSETMERLSKEYQRRSNTAISIIGQTIGYVVWAVVIVLIVILIFRAAGMYIGMINQAASPDFMK